MAQEIERKFLVKGEFKSLSSSKYHITQGYITTDPKKSVRIRIKDDHGYITIKGIGDKDGLSRYEWEKEIPLNEAKELLNLCEVGIIDKTRYEIPVGDHIFEIDEFHGENAGLIIAEVELKGIDDAFIKPDFIGEEVTGNNRYYNSYLSKHPYNIKSN